MKYLLLVVLFIGCVAKDNNEGGITIIDTENLPTTQELPDDLEPEIDEEINTEEHVDSYEPNVFAKKLIVSTIRGVDYLYNDKPIVLPQDLEVGEFGLDFQGRCYIYRTTKGSYITCKKSECSEKERKYLVARYSFYEFFIRKGMQSHRWARKRTRTRNAYNECAYKVDERRG